MEQFTARDTELRAKAIPRAHVMHLRKIERTAFWKISNSLVPY